MSVIPWRVTISHQALDDIDRILSQTLTDFGTHQLQVYSGLLRDAVEALEIEGKKAKGQKARGKLGNGIYSFPIARAGRKASHLMYLRCPESDISEWMVVRILHVRMDASLHID